MIKGWISTPIYTDRHFIISIAAFYIIFAYLINLLPKILKKITIALIVVVSIINLFFIHRFYVVEKRANYRDCIAYLNTKSEKIIFVDTPTNYNTNTLKYYAKDSISKYLTISTKYSNFKKHNINEDFYIFYDSIALKKSLIAIDSISQHYIAEEDTSFKGLKIIKMHPKKKDY